MATEQLCKTVYETQQSHEEYWNEFSDWQEWASFEDSKKFQDCMVESGLENFLD